MEQIRIEGLAKPVSRLILGCSSAPMRKGGDCGALFDCAVQAGINAFDTARGYGKSERVVGAFLKEHGDAVLISKGALHGLFGKSRVKEGCIRTDLKKSLSVLGTERIDVYLLHRDDERTEVGRIVELMNGLIGEGGIACYGVSNWRYRRIEAANEYAYRHGLKPVAVSEPQYSLCVAGKFPWFGCISVTGEAQAEERAWYQKTRLPLFAFSPLGGGFLSGRIKSADGRVRLRGMVRKTYGSAENFERLKRAERLAEELSCTVPEIALAYVLSSEMNVCAILGSSSVENLKENLGALALSLTDTQRAYLNLES